MMQPNVHDNVLCHSESYVPPGAAIQEDDSFFHRNVGGWIAGIRMARVPQVNNHPLRGNRAQRHLLIGSAKRSTDPSRREQELIALAANSAKPRMLHR
jgi:hypothetical protein